MKTQGEMGRGRELRRRDRAAATPIVIDGAPEHGGRNRGMRPMELVLLGAAACTAFDVVLILKKARQPIADCVVEAEAERARDRAQGVHQDPPALYGRRPRARSAAGRARGQAVEGQVLLGDDDARARPPRSPTRSRSSTATASPPPASLRRQLGSAARALSRSRSSADQARRIPAAAALRLHARVELVDERGHRQRGAVGARFGEADARGPCASSRRRSRSRTCRRPSSCRGCPSATTARRPCRSRRARARRRARPSRRSRCLRRAPGPGPAMQIWLTIFVSWPLPGPPISVTARRVVREHGLGARERRRRRRRP